MTDHRSTYAARFLDRHTGVAIVRPPAPLTDAQWRAHIDALDGLARTMAEMAYAFGRAFPPPAVAPGPPPRTVAFLLRPR